MKEDGFDPASAECEFFYHFLNVYGNSKYDVCIEEKQRAQIEKEFANEREEILGYYNEFEAFFDKFVQKNTSNNAFFE